MLICIDRRVSNIPKKATRPLHMLVDFMEWLNSLMVITLYQQLSLKDALPLDSAIVTFEP
jgi:hypothetical protein